MKLLLAGCLLFFSVISYPQQYNVLLIPDSMRKGADVVKRHEEYVLTIQSPAKYTLYEKHVYTILNPSAQPFAKFVTYYDKFTTINSVSGVLYDMMGKEVRRLKKKDWEDNAAFDGFSLLNDSRYKRNEFFYTDYPFTVEYEEEDENNGTQGFPRWMPQRSPGMSVQLSRFTVIAPANYVLRYKKINFAAEPVITQKGDNKVYTWEIKNLSAKKYERGAPPFSEIAASIIFAPSEFEVAGYKGNMSTWEGFGKFMYQLIKGRDVLPDEIKKKVHELTDAVNDPKEKIKILYDYMQKNTRYISIQLGIGGWQPFEAAYVAEKKYGDCKALSNYMIALLKEAGITGKYVEIYAGDDPPRFNEDFPSSQANHVIACVPLDNDTMWLECTSQVKSPGYMGSFTGNRKAILIDETGGHVVHTPVYTANDNMQLRKIKAVVSDDGAVVEDVESRYTGLQQDMPHAWLHQATPEQRQKHLNEMFNLPTYEVVKSEYEEVKGKIPALKEKLQIRLSNFANITGKRLFITPGLFGSASEKLAADTARLYDYVIDDAYVDIDSVEIKIPAGYKAESMPKEISLQTKYGNYVSSVTLTGDKLIYYRRMEQNSGRFTAKEYNEIVKFYEQVSKSDRTKAVLVKQE